MQLEEMTIEQLLQEVQRRKAAKITELQGKAKLAREALAEIEKELREAGAEGIPTTARRVSWAKRETIRKSYEERQAEILHHLAAAGRQSRGQLATATRATKGATAYALSEMVKAGTICMEGNRAKARYFLPKV